MNFLEQFAILIACLFVGSILKALIPLPIPETIYGMAILFILFAIKALKTSDEKEHLKPSLKIWAFFLFQLELG